MSSLATTPCARTSMGVRADARRRYELVRADGEVAPGVRAEQLYLERFNLTAADVVVLGARRHARATAATPASAYMNYLRAVFLPGFFYSVEGLRPSLWFYVLHTKVLAGRDQEWPSDDALGRPLSVAFFEGGSKCEEEAPVVTRCSRDTPSLVPSAVTLAELIRARGYIAAVCGDASVQEEEDALVHGWLQHERQQWRHERIVGHADVWAHVLDSPAPAERHYLETTHPNDMTRMGCARFLEVCNGADREDLWRRLDKDALVAAVGVPVAAVGRARRRGRGRGRTHGGR